MFRMVLCRVHNVAFFLGKRKIIKNLITTELSRCGDELSGDELAMRRNWELYRFFTIKTMFFGSGKNLQNYY